MRGGREATPRLIVYCIFRDWVNISSLRSFPVGASLLPRKLRCAAVPGESLAAGRERRKDGQVSSLLPPGGKAPRSVRLVSYCPLESVAEKHDGDVVTVTEGQRGQGKGSARHREEVR